MAEDAYDLGNYFTLDGWKKIAAARGELHVKNRTERLEKLDKEQGTRYQEVLSRIDPDSGTGTNAWIDHSEELWTIEDWANAFSGSGFLKEDGTPLSAEDKEKIFKSKTEKAAERVDELKSSEVSDVKHLVKEKLYPEQKSVFESFDEAGENLGNDAEWRVEIAEEISNLKLVLEEFADEFDESQRSDVKREIERLSKESGKYLSEEQRRDITGRLDKIRIDTVILDHSLNKRDRLSRRDVRILELNGKKMSEDEAGSDDEREEIRKHNDRIEGDIKAVEESKKRLEELPELGLGALTEEQRHLAEDYLSKSVYLNVLVSEILAVNETDNERMHEMIGVLGELRAELSELNEQIKFFVWERPGGKYYKMVNMQDVSGHAEEFILGPTPAEDIPDSYVIKPNFNVLFWGKEGEVNWHVVDGNGSVLEIPENQTATLKIEDGSIIDAEGFEEVVARVVANKTSNVAGGYAAHDIDSLPDVAVEDIEASAGDENLPVEQKRVWFFEADNGTGRKDFFRYEYDQDTGKLRRFRANESGVIIQKEPDLVFKNPIDNEADAFLKIEDFHTVEVEGRNRYASVSLVNTPDQKEEPDDVGPFIDAFFKNDEELFGDNIVLSPIS